MSSNINNLLNGANLKIISVNNFSSLFYSAFSNEINNYFSDPNNNLNSKSEELVAQLFGGTLTSNQYQILNTAIASISPIYNQPIVQTFFTNITDNTFVNLLTTGHAYYTIPTPDQQVQIANVATLINPTLTNNFTSCMSYLRSSQFSCMLNYTGYAGNQQFVLDFSSPISDNMTGACLGLIAFADQNNIDPNDVNLLVNLINLYSNTTSLTLAANNANLQSGAIQYFQTFSTNFLSAASAFTPLPVASIPNRTGATNAPSKVTSRPGLLDANLEIISSASINAQGVGPSGVVLNQFTEPPVNDVNSILDIIRNRHNVPVANISGNTIYVQGSNTPINTNNGPTSQNSVNSSQIYGTQPTSIAPTSFTGPTGVISILKQNQVLGNAVSAMQDAIDQANESLNNLTEQINSIIDTPEFVATAIIAAGLSASYADQFENGNSQIEFLKSYYTTLSNGIQAQPALYSSSNANTSNPVTSNTGSTGQTSTIQSSIAKANYLTISSWNVQFRQDLEIYTTFNNNTTIPQSVINQVMQSTQNNPPPEFQTLLSQANRGDIQTINTNIQNICQGVLSQIQEVSQQQTDLNNQINQYTTILNELQSAQNS